MSNGWSDEDFYRVRGALKQYTYTVDIKKVEFIPLKDFLKQKRSFLVRLLENPVLIEHAEFTEVLHFS